MLWSKRHSSSSRSDLYSNTTKNQPQLLTSSSRRPSLSAAGISASPSARLPFALLDPLRLQASQFTLAATSDDMPSSFFSSDRDHPVLKHPVTRQTVSRDTSDRKYNQSPASGRRPQSDQNRRDSIPSLNSAAGVISTDPVMQATDSDCTDLYTYNTLNSFSFGSVSPQFSSSSRSFSPLSGHDDPENSNDDPVRLTDVTPRPSVVSYMNNPHTSVRSHPTQPPPGLSEWSPPPVTHSSPGNRPRVAKDRDRHRGRSTRDSDTASRQTFDTSSASVSVTSFSSTSNSRTGSRASRHTNTTSQTTAADLSSTDDEGDHHHPIPPHLADDVVLTGNESSGTGTGNNTAVEFSSDEEYDDSEYDYDYDYYDDNRMNIEIGSAQYEGSIATHDWERDLYSYRSESSSSVRALGLGGSSERRGSLPMPIPGAVAPPSDMRGDALFAAARDMEGDLSALRRPSRSLDNEFQMGGFGAGHGHMNVHSGSSGSRVMINEGLLNRPLPPAPVSVPESDGDWKNLEERSKMKGKAREAGSSSFASSSPFPGSGQDVGNAMDGFDLDWSALRGGITALDQSQVADIIRPADAHHNRHHASVGAPNNYTGSDARRPSAANLRWMTRWNNINNGDNNARRPSTATVSSIYGGDSFGKAIGKWGGDGYQAQRRDWSFRREKADRVGPGGEVGISNVPGASGIVESSGIVGGSGINKEKERERDVAKEGDKEKAVKPSTPWRGMQLNSQEVWKNDLVGRFKVDRRANKPSDPAKGPQQRLMIHHFRDPYTLIPSPHNGPPVTIHKHSKANAFSISRYYKPRMMVLSRDGSFVGGARRPPVGDSRIGSSRAPPSRDGNVANNPAGGTAAPAVKKSSSMILLAPRKVQEAFTSTNSTRRLESHGLLDDRGTGTGNLSEARDRDREKEKAKRQRERERQKQKEREKQQEKEKRRKPADEAKNNSKGKLKQQVKDDSHFATSSGGAASGGTHVATGSTFIAQPIPPPPMSAPSLHTYPPSPTTLPDYMDVGHVSRFPEHTISRNPSRTSRRRRRIRDPLDDEDEDEDEDGDDENAPPTRTPHSEAYGTMDASVIEQLRPRQDRSHVADADSGPGIFKRFMRSRGVHSAPGPASGQIEPFFEPPWIVMASRNKQEQQQRVVDNLNTSFKDVGLLPSTHKERTRHAHSSHKQKKIASGNANTVDIFEEVPSDSLYMLLPLWPGDTDPVSERKVDHTAERPHIPSEQRQYLLVYYKPSPEAAHADDAGKRADGDGKRRSRNSPTSSHDSSARREDRTSILLSSFHISARLVSYRDLQGSGVRVPDEGLTVTGPLDLAYETMPAAVRDEGLFDWVIGVCHSREAGIEFYPEGLVKMGLCLQTSVPFQRPESEEDMPPEPNAELTPIGRAVLEMAWLGGMALTSFGPGT